MYLNGRPGEQAHSAGGITMKVAFVLAMIDMIPERNDIIKPSGSILCNLSKLFYSLIHQISG